MKQILTFLLMLVIILNSSVISYAANKISKVNSVTAKSCIYSDSTKCPRLYEGKNFVMVRSAELFRNVKFVAESSGTYKFTFSEIKCKRTEFPSIAIDFNWGEGSPGEKYQQMLSINYKNQPYTTIVLIPNEWIKQSVYKKSTVYGSGVYDTAVLKVKLEKGDTIVFANSLLRVVDEDSLTMSSMKRPVTYKVNIKKVN